jgi:hypothetical protein
LLENGRILEVKLRRNRADEQGKTELTALQRTTINLKWNETESLHIPAVMY